MALLSFLAQLLQRLLELLDLLAQLREVLINGICFLTAFLSVAEIGFLLSVFLKPTTITSVVHGIHAPMPLVQVAMLLETDLLGNPDLRLGTKMLLPFLALMRSFPGRFQLGLLMGADALDHFK
jgi:hypothetical protein